MKKIMFLMLFLPLIFSLASCQNRYSGISPAIVPDMPEKTTKKEAVKIDNMRVIGAVEPIYILPIKAPFYARIDTGAETSSIDVTNLTNFERDGEKWVSFDITNRTSGETAHFEKKIKKRIVVKRIDKSEKRKIVYMQVKFAGETFNARFSLADRSEFDYQALVGRNILMGRAVVDVSSAKTLR